MFHFSAQESPLHAVTGDWTLYPGCLSPHGASIMKYEDEDSLPDLTTPSPREYVDTNDGFVSCPITRNTIIAGDGEIPTVAVECIGEISGHRLASKAIFEVIYNGATCIARCWGLDGFDKYAIESRMYETIERRKNNGVDVPDCFARCFFTGQIMCSSIFPEGYMIVLEKRDGEVVSDIFEELSYEEQMVLLQGAQEAILVLDECDIEVTSPGLFEDMLFCRQTGLTTLLDFASLCETGDGDLMDESEDSDENESDRSATSDQFAISDEDYEASSEDTV